MQATRAPLVVVVAGPNGAGKTTAAPRLLQGALAVQEFVNADAIAQGLSYFRPHSVEMAAGRIMLERIRTLAADRRDFAFETTLASRSFAPWLRRLRESGYRTHLSFLALPSADLAVARVAGRVRRGGHAVPEPVIRRRYAAGLANLVGLYRAQADRWEVLDNSDDEPRLIASGEGIGGTMVVDGQSWARLLAVTS